MQPKQNATKYARFEQAVGKGDTIEVEIEGIGTLRNTVARS